MLYLVFELGRDRFALEARRVAEVLPLVEITPVSGASHGVAGVFVHRGAPVPAIDLGDALFGRPVAGCPGARLILLNHEAADGTARRVGLIAEHATDTLRLDPSAFASSGVAGPDALPVATDARGLIQRLDPDALLSGAVRAALADLPVEA